MTATNEPSEVLVQPGGKALVAGMAFRCGSGGEVDGVPVNDCAGDMADRAWITAVRFNRRGRIDSSFGGGAGKFALELPLVPNQNASALIGAGQLPDGALLLAARTGSDSAVVARVDPDGVLDPSYGVGGLAHVNVPGPRAAAVSPVTGQTVIAGSARTGALGVGTITATRVAANGTLDTGFGSGGISAISSSGASLLTGSAAPYAADQVLISGTYERIDDQAGRIDSSSATAAVLRLRANGTLDTGFGSNGIQRVGPMTGQTYAPLFTGAPVVAELPDGRVSVGGVVGQGDVKGVPGCAMAFIARLGPDGAPDDSFGTSGISPIPTDFCGLYDAITTPIGDTVALSYGNAGLISRLDRSGVVIAQAQVDLHGARRAPLLRASAAALGLEPDKGLIVALRLKGKNRWFTRIPGKLAVVTAFALARFNPDGSRDRTFGTRGLATWPPLAK